MRVMFEIIDSYIYFIQMKTGPIKIGRAKDPFMRLKELQTGNPYDLEILYFFPGGVKTERATLGVLNESLMKGEWFWPTRRVFEEIQSEAFLSKKQGWSMEKYDPEIDFVDNRLQKNNIENASKLSKE